MALTTVSNAGLAGSIDLTAKVTGTLPTGNGGTGSTATTFVNMTSNVTGTLPAANGGTGATSYTATKFGQIIEGSKYTQFETSSTSYVDAGLSVTITPAAASSKILLMAATSSIHIATTSAGGQVQGRFYRNVESAGDTAIDNSNGFQLAKSRQDGSYDQEVGGTGFMTYLDSPSYTLTDAIVYKVYIQISNGQYGRICSNTRIGRITAIEIFA